MLNLLESFLHNFILYKPDTLFAGETVYQHYGMPGLHYIDVMLFVLATSVLIALGANRVIFRNRARYIGPGASKRFNR